MLFTMLIIILFCVFVYVRLIEESSQIFVLINLRLFKFLFERFVNHSNLTKCKIGTLLCMMLYDVAHYYFWGIKEHLDFDTIERVSNLLMRRERLE